MSRITTTSRRRGVAMIYVVVSITVGLAMASLAVDFARVQIAKTQLHGAADAAARAAVAQLGTTVQNVQNTAAQYAAANSCDGMTVTIDKNNDVEFIDWNPTTRTATVLNGAARSYANAVRVYCRRTGNNAIPLTFGWMAGMTTCNANASATAAIIPPGYGLVGIDFISLKGNSSASYWSSTGTVGGAAGNIASNGNITSTGNAMISGTVWTLANATVSGITANARRTLPAPLNYANGNAGSYNTTNNNNSLLPSGVYSGGNWSINNNSYQIPAGVYFVKNLNMSASGGMTLLGPVTIYVYGSVTLGGQTTTAANLPTNLKIVMVHDPNNGNAPGSVQVSSGAALYADIYAPESAITLAGNGAIYGQVVGKSITMTGSSDIYYDLSLPGTNNLTQLVQ
jgi:Flp pilus assembly protein TadG